MNRQQFKETLEKLNLYKPRTVEVLRRLLAGDTDAQIALSRGRNKGTVRKQISKIYQDFGIKGKFPGDRQSRRNELIALFHKYHPEWVHDCSPAVTHEVSDEGKKVNQNGLSQPVSLSMKESEVGEDLMALAITMLTQLGFDEMFNVNRSSQSTGYRLKNDEKGASVFKLVLSQTKEGLYIFIVRELLESHILIFNYWFYLPEIEKICSYVAGRIWILPTKKSLFLESLIYECWDIILANDKTVGDVYLNKRSESKYEYVKPDSEIIPIREFSTELLSDKSSYLILNENKPFPYNYQVCITSSDVLKEFIGYFGKILIENQ